MSVETHNVVGGLYDGVSPAGKNIRIIDWLRDNYHVSVAAGQASNASDAAH